MTIWLDGVKQLSIDSGDVSFDPSCDVKITEFDVHSVICELAGLITPPGVFPWSVINADQTLAVNHGYFTTGAGRLILPLPAVSTVGQMISVKANNANGWRITQTLAAGQVVTFGNINSAVGIAGYTESKSIGDVLTIVCSVANVQWDVWHSVGEITYI